METFIERLSLFFELSSLESRIVCLHEVDRLTKRSLYYKAKEFLQLYILRLEYFSFDFGKISRLYTSVKFFRIQKISLRMRLHNF